MSLNDSGLRSLYRAASWSAFLILFGMLIHNINASWLEPTYLGFVDKAKDYGDMAKIQNAVEACSFSNLELCSFKYSGFAHMFNGLFLILLSIASLNLLRNKTPVLAQFTCAAAFLSGIGFLLTGITDIPGTAYANLLRELNPQYNDTILLISTMIRGVVNILAITGLGLFAAFFGYASLKAQVFSNWGARYGFILLLPGIGGLISPIFGFMYLVFCLPWFIWLGLQFSKLSRQ
ncbi:MAG: hypothetical protein VYA80_04445 [Pseudomonadota bacterium]|nr:hypothetical protein [Pseudomonadota bacterium]